MTTQKLTYKELKKLSILRKKEAKALLDAQMWHAACYLAGYSIELALKACIAKNINKEIFFEKKSIEGLYTHNFITLLQLAGLSSDLDAKKRADTTFSANWSILSTWKETLRYQDHLSAHSNHYFHLKVLSSDKSVEPVSPEQLFRLAQTKR